MKIMKTIDCLSGYKSPEQCEACADGFISTHEKATAYLTSKIEEAKKQEQERILKYLKALLETTPKASLASTIDLIETTKGGGE